MKNEPDNKKMNKNWLLLVGVILVIGIVVLLLWFLMRGEIKTAGDWPEDETTESLSCVVEKLTYKFFKSNNIIDNIRINVVFNNNKINSISLVTKTTYPDNDTTRAISDGHEGDMNLSFYDNGMDSYSLGATYSVDNNFAQISLYATSSELNDVSIQYFMLDTLPKNIDEYKKAYANQGFTCEIVKK